MLTAERRAIYKPDHHTQQDIRTLGILFFMEAHRRILGGRFGSIPTPIKDWAFAEGGYCIDAPDTLPAGGSEFYALDPTGIEDLCDEFGHYGLPQQLTVPREPDDTPGVAVRQTIDTADHVKHGPTGETWVVARVNGEHLHPCGWPPTRADLSDCTLVKKATLAEREQLLRDLSQGQTEHAGWAAGALGVVTDGGSDA